MEPSKELIGNYLRTLHSPRYSDEEHKGPIVFEGIYGDKEVEFYASPNDVMEYGRNIYFRALNGHYGEIGEYVSPAPEPQPTEPTPDLFAEKTT